MDRVKSSRAASPGELMLQRGRSVTLRDGTCTVHFNDMFAATPEVFIQSRGSAGTVPVVAKILSLNEVGFRVALHKYDGSGFVPAPNQAFSWIAAGALQPSGE